MRTFYPQGDTNVWGLGRSTDKVSVGATETPTTHLAEWDLGRLANLIINTIHYIYNFKKML